MVMSKLSIDFLLMAISSVAWADIAKCVIQIQDVNLGTKYKVEQSFTVRLDSEAQRKHFALPGSNVSCTLAFFDLQSGTMLSCQRDELGHHFVQSDRSAIHEGRAKNKVSFRYRSSFYVLKSDCS